jgi:hypothetical protein
MNNERIDKLVEQAITQNESGWPDFRKALTGSGSLYLHVFAEEFAELIVRECAQVSEDDITDGDACCTNTADRIARQIKKHFGVE